MVILLTVGCLKSFSSSPGKSTIIFRSWTSWLGVNIGKEYGVLSYEKKQKEKNEKKHKILVHLSFVTVKPTYVAQWVHLMIWTEIHILVKEAQLKSMKEKKYQDFITVMSSFYTPRYSDELKQIS